MSDETLPLHVDELGAGPDVVLLHGSPTEPEHMHRLARELADTHRCWVVHSPGYGRSPALAPGYTVEQIQLVIEAAVSQRGIRTARFVGFSGGAYHALALALRGNVEVRAIASLSGFAGLDEAARAGMRGFADLLPTGFDGRPLMPSRMLSPAFAEANPESCAEVSRWATATSAVNLESDLRALAGAPDLLPRLAELDVPIVARVGELDVSAPKALSEAIVAHARRATLEVVPGAGHALLLEDLARTAVSVRQLLASA